MHDVCPNVERKDTLLKHETIKHAKSKIVACDEKSLPGNEFRNFSCAHCDYRTAKLKMLQLHKRFAHKVKTHECQICEFRTLDEELFEKHKITKHLECNLFDFKTTIQQVLHIHQRLHRPYAKKRKSTTDVFED